MKKSAQLAVRNVEQLLDLEQAAAYLKLSKQTLYNFVARGRLRAYKCGRYLRFRPDDLDDLVVPRPVTRRQKP